MIPRFLLMALLMGRLASGQVISNGSFATGDFTGWQVAGTPAVLGSPPTPVAGNFQALINSTGSNAPGIYATTNAVSAAALNTFLGTTLPANANGAPINGEAIQQTFTTTVSTTITFSYAYQSREAPGNGYDETGYVLNGVFHILADTNTPGQTMANATGFFVWGLPYQTASITVGPGTNTLGFVAYNTFDLDAPSGLFIDNIVVTMNFSQWEASYSLTGGPTESSENDGVPNLLKYLYDINPTVPMSATDRAACPAVGMTTVSGTQYLTLTYRQNTQAAGVAVNVQTSPDLQNWTTVNPPDLCQQIGTDPNTGDPIMEVGVKAVGSANQFIRLNAISP
jgi:hypothetical protein